MNTNRILKSMLEGTFSEQSKLIKEELSTRANVAVDYIKENNAQDIINKIYEESSESEEV